MLKLTLTEKDIDAIGKESKSNKYRITANDDLYTDDCLKRAKFFVDSHRFFVNISNTLSFDDGVRKNMRGYILQFDDVYVLLNSLLVKYDSNKFGNHFVRNKISKILIDNRVVVDSLIDMSHQVGKVVKTYNPDEEQGYY